MYAIYLNAHLILDITYHQQLMLFVNQENSWI